LTASSAAATAEPAAPVAGLPALAVDGEQVSVSGVSSGGGMAVQVHVAFSGAIRGAGVIAGSPYYCAGAGYPWTLFRALGRCTGAFGPLSRRGPDVAASLAEVQRRAQAGDIDDPGGLHSDRVYLFSGSKDAFAPRAVMDSLQAFYGAFVDRANIHFVDDIPAGHAMVTTGFGTACGASASPFLTDCDYDTAGALLAHIYGPLEPAVAAEGLLLRFDQREFTANPAAIGLAAAGHAYIPRACQFASGCRLHVAFHGCQQDEGAIGDVFVRHAGYNGWAEANRIVVLYPQTTPLTTSVLGIRLPWPNPLACWDWWGYAGEPYHIRQSPQVAAVKAMIDRLTAPSP
jgi:hypothetical protein